MDSSNGHSKDPQNEDMAPLESNNQMVDEQQESSNNFTERQIQIIRSYIGDLNLDPQQKSTNLSQIVEKIHQQTELQTKSSKEIQALIHKLLCQQGEQNEAKIEESKPLVSCQHPIDEIKEEVSQQMRKPVFPLAKNLAIQNPQDEGMFQPKSLFKSFNEPNDNGGFKDCHKLGFTSENNFSGIKKVNLFTKPSIELTKSAPGSNGFVSLMEAGSLGPSKQAMETQYNDGAEFPSFAKKATKQFKETSEGYQIKSKRKIRPSNPIEIDPALTNQQRIEWIENNTNDCHTILEKKLAKRAGNANKEAFYLNEKFSGIYNEYFYSNYDKAYFSQQNQFSKLVSCLGLDPKRMSFKEFKLLKQALPQPRLFNIEFIISQQNKLNEFRSQLRQIPKQRAKTEEIEMVVGREVTALHPVCGHLHSGTILAIYKENQYMVKFTRPELGTQKVLDINICTRTLSGTNKAAVENIDYESMVMVIKLLEFKGELLERFKQYNDIIEQMKEEHKDPDNQLLQEYGWLGSTINILSMGSEDSIHPTPDQQLVGKNFSSLLINPLNLMSKELQNSSQQSDIETSNQIKNMASNRANSRIEEYLRSLTLRNNHYIDQSEMNPEQKENMSILLKNFIGMLLNFRFQGRNFSIQSNKYLLNIHKLIDADYTEQFNQIYTNVHSIVKKIGQTQ